MSEIKGFLKNIELFIGLTDPMLEKVAALCSAETYDPHSIIIQHQDPADKFYLIEEGTVEILTGDTSGPHADAVVVTLGKGQVFGEMALIDSGRRSATVRTATQAQLYAIDCAAFMELCETDTDLGYQVMRNIAVDLSFKLRYRNLI